MAKKPDVLLPQVETAAMRDLKARLKKIHVLIVVSGDHTAALLDRMFTEVGFTNITIAKEAVEAAEKLRHSHVHLVITDSDLKLGGNESHASGGDLSLSGIKFVQRLRHAPNSPAPFVPVLMLMNSVKDEDLFKARDAGVNEVLLCPLDARDFCSRLITIIDRPKPYVTAQSYKGPCRRRKGSPPPGVAERRVREVRVIRCNELKDGSHE